MEGINEKSNLTEYFNSDNLVPQKVYKSKRKFIPLYINAPLYEQLFHEKYDESIAFENISNLFSITLDKEKSNNEYLDDGYADKQFDPMGISLSGNLGSGRAYFYGKYFNIKGDKTTLATSPKEVYSNGKFSLGAAIKETIISNIVSKELTIPTFETLAILDTTDTFEFINEYLATDDSVKEERYILPSVIEIRVNADRRLYRISNAFINKDNFSFENLKTLSDKLALLEAEKFIKRFLHGSWSVGNISVDANLIDFDTASFVKGRNPQYSNTNKYKSNYFGYEILGSKTILKLIFDSASNDLEHEFTELDTFMDLKYNEYLKKNFCQIIGLDYDIHYTKYSNLIDKLFEKFMKLSRKFLPNYYDLNIYEENNNDTFIFDFSSFFGRYLAGKRHNRNNILFGISLLLNETKIINYKKIGFIKDKVDEFFKEHIISDSDDSYILDEAISFINLYNELFDTIENEYDLKDIIFKQYILNMNRQYLYGNEYTYSILSNLYTDGLLDNLSLNKIINYLITSNIRNFSEAIKEYQCNLSLYENYLSYMVISKNYYYFILVPYTDFKIRFAKLIIDREEYMLHHNMETENILHSEKIPYENIDEIINAHIDILINGKSNQKRLILEK